MLHKLLVPLDSSPVDDLSLGAARTIARASGASIDLELMFSRDASKNICAHAADVNADLIVMTSGGDAELGSVAQGVLRESTIPVLLLRAKEASYEWPKIVNVLVPLDGSGIAADVLSVASSLAHCTQGRLLLLEVVQPAPLASMDLEAPFVAGHHGRDDEMTQSLSDEAERHLVGVATDLGEDRPADVETHVVFAENIAAGITEFARRHEVNVVAMSTHGLGMSRHVLGGIADDVRRNCGLPMLLRRPFAKSTGAGLGSVNKAVREQPVLIHA
jgi:nucleotide-binding universal stress UspA family protein